MINDFEHLDNGLTIIFCRNTKEDVIEDVFINTKMFNYIRSFNVEWKIWDDNSKKGKNVAGTNIDNGKILNLKRVIGQYLYGEEYNFSLLNDNSNDLRNSNVFKFNVGTGHSSKVKSEKNQLLKELEPLIKDIDIIPSNNNVLVVKYQDKLLLLQNNKVVVELDLEQANAVIQFHENS